MTTCEAMTSVEYIAFRSLAHPLNVGGRHFQCVMVKNSTLDKAAVALLTAAPRSRESFRSICVECGEL